jgi:hypothetical protein
MILSKDDERRAEGIFFHVQTASDALDKASFACSKLTHEKKHVRFLG